MSWHTSAAGKKAKGNLGIYLYIIPLKMSVGVLVTGNEKLLSG